jgi:hypothetical protein
MSEKVRVIVEISGGVCQAVYAGPFVEVVILDHDDRAADTDEGAPYSPLIQKADAWSRDAENIWASATRPPWNET